MRATTISTSQQPQETKLAASPLDGNSLIPAEAIERIGQIQAVQHDLAGVMSATGDHFVRGVALAKAAVKLRELMSPNVMATLHELANSPFGFKIDRPDKYTEDEIRDLLIQGMLAGLRPTGNEINLLGGNLYCTKEAYQRALKEKRVRYELLIGAMEVSSDKQTCMCRAAIKYSYRGDSGALVFDVDDDGRNDYRIVIRSFATDGPDLRAGKVTSKLLRRLYAHLFGQPLQASFADDEDDVIDGEGVVIADPSQVKLEQKFDAQGRPV